MNIKTGITLGALSFGYLFIASYALEVAHFDLRGRVEALEMQHLELRNEREMLETRLNTLTERFAGVECQAKLAIAGVRMGHKQAYNLLLNYFGPIIQPAAERYGVDPHLIASVIWAESRGNANAVSRAGARGLMQLIDKTAESVGVKDSYDPVQNVNGGTLYLARMLDRFQGDLPLALAAYNAGPDAVERWSGIPPYPETQTYINRVISTYEFLRSGPIDSCGRSQTESSKVAYTPQQASSPAIAFQSED